MKKEENRKMNKKENNFDSPEKRKEKEDWSDFANSYLDGDNNVNLDNNGHGEMDDKSKDVVLKIIPKEDVIVGKHSVQIKLPVDPAVKAELDRFALMTINNRIEFCQKYKTGDVAIGDCVCESVRRFVRLSKESRMKNVTKAQIRAVEKMIEKMKKEGTIKCSEVNKLS